MKHTFPLLMLSAWFGVLLSVCAGESQNTASVAGVPDKPALDAVREWFSRGEYGKESLAERRERMAVIQKACDQLSAEAFGEYRAAWRKNPKRADALESTGALYYLRQAQRAAIQDIKHTTVTKGLAVWQLYNTGYVFKTPTSCFGIDLFLRDAKDLEPDLDLLLLTHEHADHRSPDLIDAMIKAGKPVVSRFEHGGTTVTKPCELTFGPLRVKVDIGDHHRQIPSGCNNMLMYEVDCGTSASGCVVYHSGDGNNFLKMKPDKLVDVFIPHVQVGMSVEDAIHHLNPKVTLVSHVLELGHSPNPPHVWRWSYDYAFRMVRNTPPDRAIVLTWGEKWLLPGTQVQ